MLKKSDPLEAYPSEGFRWNWVEPVGIKLGVASFSVQCEHAFKNKTKPKRKIQSKEPKLFTST